MELEIALQLMIMFTYVNIKYVWCRNYAKVTLQKLILPNITISSDKQNIVIKIILIKNYVYYILLHILYKRKSIK